MEDVEYSMAKRYAETMKTMWLTFFYAPAIPIGIVWSIFGIILYALTDKVKTMIFLTLLLLIDKFFLKNH